MKRLPLFALVLSLFAGVLHAQQPTPASQILTKKSPYDPVPGLIGRICIGDKPTHLLMIFRTGTEFKDPLKAKAVDALRGAFKNPDAIDYHGFGFIILDKDTEVSFAVGNNNCLISGKNMGPGTYKTEVKKGKRPIDLTRKDGGQGQGGCTIVDPATGETVLFHTGQMLATELSRSFKVNGKMMKSVLLEADPVATPKP
jgi:hypothetical protein